MRERTHNHGGEIVRSVVVGPSTGCFEGLFSALHDLFEVYTFEEFGNSSSGTSFVAYQNLDSSDLVEPKCAVIAGRV